MKYEDIIGRCDTTTVSQVVSRCPDALNVLEKHMPEVDAHRQATLEMVASLAGVNQEILCQEIFDVMMAETPLEDVDTDVLLELIQRGYDIENLKQLPRLHRLARKIEAIHRDNPEVPRGITMTIKSLEKDLKDHIEREEQFVLERMEHDQPPRPDTPIAQMNEEHSELRQVLKKMRRLTANYRPPESACRSWRRLYRELQAFDTRLSEQIYLERDILFPRFQF